MVVAGLCKELLLQGPSREDARPHHPNQGSTTHTTTTAGTGRCDGQQPEGGAGWEHWARAVLQEAEEEQGA